MSSASKPHSRANREQLLAETREAGDWAYHIELLNEKNSELEEQLEAFREFFDAHWMVEKGVTDFDLHGEAVERLHRAFNAVYAFHSPEPSPAKRPKEEA